MQESLYVENRFGVRGGNFIFDLISLDPIAIGTIEQPVLQQKRAIAIGRFAGAWNQHTNAIALGEYAGSTQQGLDAIAIATDAGANYQQAEAIAIGVQAGYEFQGTKAIAIGSAAGLIQQGQYAVAFGNESGYLNQGDYAIAIGFGAGKTAQPSHSIILNASGTEFSPINQGFYVQPIRSFSESTNSFFLARDPNSKEIFQTNVDANQVQTLVNNYNVLAGRLDAIEDQLASLSHIIDYIDEVGNLVDDLNDLREIIRIYTT